MYAFSVSIFSSKMCYPGSSSLSSGALAGKAEIRLQTLRFRVDIHFWWVFEISGVPVSNLSWNTHKFS
jgi:hypothetical protein